MSALAKLWEAARTEMYVFILQHLLIVSETGDDTDEAVVHFSWIPQAIFLSLQVKDLPPEGR